MKYEFHVGDYVETKDGDIGVITKVNPDDSSCWYGSVCWYCTYNRDPRTKNQTHVIPDGTDADIAKFFNHIGQYDFTKKDDSKIELLEYNGSPDWDDSLLLDKINELIEVVID